ncbi:hypothetical protein VTO42DRAFT_7699 [Malbranchea cinnamomea]
MVRIKHRYLLVNILYPPTGQSSSFSLSSKNNNTDWETQFHLQLCRPTTDALTPALLARMIRDAVDELYGDWGVGRLGGAGAGALSVKYFSPATSTAIIRCPRASYRLVWSALTYISRLPEQRTGKSHHSKDGTKQPFKTLAAVGGQLQRDCAFRVMRVSGTMKKAEQEAIKRARMEVVRVMRSGEEKGAEMLEEMFGDGIGSAHEENDEESDG